MFSIFYFALLDDVVRIWPRETSTFEHIDNIGFTVKNVFKWNRICFFFDLLDNFSIEKIIIFFSTYLPSNGNFRLIDLSKTLIDRIFPSIFSNHNSTIGIVEDNFDVCIQCSTIDTFMHEIVPTFSWEIAKFITENKLNSCKKNKFKFLSFFVLVKTNRKRNSIFHNHFDQLKNRISTMVIKPS